MEKKKIAMKCIDLILSHVLSPLNSAKSSVSLPIYRVSQIPNINMYTFEMNEEREIVVVVVIDCGDLCV